MLSPSMCVPADLMMAPLMSYVDLLSVMSVVSVLHGRTGLTAITLVGYVRSQITSSDQSFSCHAQVLVLLLLYP